MDSNAAYDSIPLGLTLDVKSKDRSDGLQYRAGLHYVRPDEFSGIIICTLRCCSAIRCKPGLYLHHIYTIPLYDKPAPLCQALEHMVW